MNSVCVHLSVLLRCRVCVAAVAHRREDVNVNTVSQRKGMCEARKKTLGTKSRGGGREG